MIIKYNKIKDQPGKVANLLVVRFFSFFFFFNLTYSQIKDQPGKVANLLVVRFFSFFFFFKLTYSRWTSSLPSCLWSQRIFPSLPDSRLTIFYRDASSALLQLVNQWLKFTYSVPTLSVTKERTQILLW